MDIAREKGCGYMYLLATGIYSQKIFRDLRFDLINEVHYNTYLDKNGQPIIDGTEEHLSAQVFAFNFNYKPQSTHM
jgi:hypothetical protein